MFRPVALGGLFLGLLFSLLTPALTAPSSAQSGSIEYRTGTYPAFIDLVGVKAKNGPRQARLELHVRDLTKRGEFRLDITHPDGLKGAYARVKHRASGEQVVEFRRWKEGGDVDPVIDCPRARLTWDTALDRIVFTIPQSCLRWYFKPPRSWSFSGTSYARIDGRLVCDSGRRWLLRQG